MRDDNRIISFDWAVKRILRDKANFGVLEGLMTVLIGEPMKIVDLLESEGNQDTADDKFNRVDIKAKNAKGDLIIVEVQLTRELYYLERILYGVSKAITEHIKLGNRYDQVKKVYSINILYFDLGRGKDYLYHGTTNFIGVHTDDYLEVNSKEMGVVSMKTPAEIFPEYYLIRVNQFNEVAKTPIEEWMDYLKNERIREDTTVPGLQEAREKLSYLRMTPEDRASYDRHIENLMYQNEALGTARTEGWEEGMEKGMEKGMKKGIDTANRENARKMKADNMPIELIVKYTGLTSEEINSL
jgi:predicted transposase/invertase (TIGR01784 family)